jgi:hypothetical protein
METTTDAINVNFFSIKRITFELCECHNQPFTSVHDFHEKLLKKNINILNIDHSNALKRIEKHTDMKKYIGHWFRLYTHKVTHGGFRRMLMMLLAFHLFYVFMIVDFKVVNIVFIALVHLSFYLIISRRAHHKFLAYLALPFYMLLFDWALLSAQIKWLRQKHNQRRKKKETV